MRIFIALLLACLCVVLPSLAQSDQDYLQARLEQLHNKLETFINEAPLSQKTTRLQMAHYWLNALGTYRNLPTLSVLEKMDKLDATETIAYNELAANISVFTANTTATDVISLSKQFVDSLPVVKNQFEVDPIPPLFTFKGKDQILEVTVTGSFPVLLKDTAEIYLYTATHKVSYTSQTDTSVTFRFLPAQLGLDVVDLFAITNINLHLVGQLGKKVNKKKQFTAVYDFYAISLPSSPGKLTIIRNSTSNNTEKQTKRTRTFLLNGSKGDLLEKQCLPAHEGWTVIPESVDLVVESSAGVKNRDWSYRKTTTGGKTCYTAEVFFNSSGPSGKLEYHLKYDIKRNTTEEKSDTSEVVLEWGEVRQLNFDIPVSSVIYTDFMGGSNTIDGGSYQSEWLQIERQENVISVKTPRIISLNTQP